MYGRNVGGEIECEHIVDYTISRNTYGFCLFRYFAAVEIVDTSGKLQIIYRIIIVIDYRNSVFEIVELRMYGLEGIGCVIKRCGRLKSPVPHTRCYLRYRAVVIPEEKARAVAVAVTEFVVVPHLPYALGVDCADKLCLGGVLVDRGRTSVAVYHICVDCADEVDTLCASLGQGLLVWYAAQLRERGRSIKEVQDWVEEHKLNLCHQFTVDDLYFLKRGGRVSAATALVGTALGIKPVLHIDNEGHLINMGKARGRRASLTALVDKMAELAVEPQGQVAFISHGDCLEDAKAVEQMLKQRLGVKKVIISYVGPVIGAHTGPGVVALFFLGKER